MYVYIKIYVCIYVYVYVDIYVCICVYRYIPTFIFLEKSVGTTELHYSTKKRYHVLTILKSFFFVRHSSEYETSDSDRKVNRNLMTAIGIVHYYGCIVPSNQKF